MTVGRPRSAKHGSRSRYNARRCRCPACVKANRAYQRGWYRRHATASAFYLAVAIELFRRRDLGAAGERNGRP